jgi:hypothetical protein
MRPELRYVSAECPADDFPRHLPQLVGIFMPVVLRPDTALLDRISDRIFELVDKRDLDNAAVKAVDTAKIVDENLSCTRIASIAVEIGRVVHQGADVIGRRPKDDPQVFGAEGRVILVRLKKRVDYVRWDGGDALDKVSAGAADVVGDLAGRQGAAGLGRSGPASSAGRGE